MGKGKNKKREYIKRWAEKLIGFASEDHSDIYEAEDEISNAIREHMEWLCEDVEVSLENVKENFEPFNPTLYIYRYKVKCGDEEIAIGASVETATHGRIFIEIDRVK
jgi:hypothetical protein